ncbi:NAD(P)H-dependent oxidoreductase [Nicoliella lavandulae]|uniref:NAD(P)H-dependent oxidoreductase n=1 Tax=Nicoliella lavandulae TaxID=3082954 RepID=A0ABU8SKN5_9LACO
MKTLILLFHPNLEGSRVNQAFRAAVENQHDDNITIRDEYALYPDGNIDVTAEQKAVESANRIIFQFPFYWYSAPSLLKKWEDVVLLYGWAYGSTGNALHGKQLGVAVSAGAPVENYRPDGSVNYTIKALLAPFKATSNMIGTKFINPFITPGVMQNLDEDQLARRAQEYVEYVTKGE